MIIKNRLLSEIAAPSLPIAADKPYAVDLIRVGNTSAGITKTVVFGPILQTI